MSDTAYPWHCSTDITETDSISVEPSWGKNRNKRTVSLTPLRTMKLRKTRNIWVRLFLSLIMKHNSSKRKSSRWAKDGAPCLGHLLSAVHCKAFQLLCWAILYFYSHLKNIYLSVDSIFLHVPETTSQSSRSYSWASELVLRLLCFVHSSA